MDFLLSISPARGFYCESKLWRRSTYRELVAGVSIRTVQSVAHKIHVWRAVLVFSWGYPISISCSRIQAEMAFYRASFLPCFVCLDVGLRSASFFFDSL